MRLIERSSIINIALWIERDEIIVIIGSRQVGKTTLLKMLLNKIDRPKVYLDLEDFQILEICNRRSQDF